MGEDEGALIKMERKKLIKALETIRMSLCCYITPERCDCKYGMGDLRKGAFGGFSSGEETGCPEMREAIGVLNLMTDKEYEKIAKRGVARVNKAIKQLKKEGKWPWST